MTNKEYREHEGISRSQLFTIINKTPFHFKYEQDHPKEDTQSLSFGRAAHKYILEKDDFYSEFAIAPECDRRTKIGKETFENFVQESKGKEVITRTDFEIIKEMAEVIDNHPFARKFLTGECEYSYFWKDLETGVACKVRPDCVCEVDGKKYIADYKTTNSCNGFDFDKSARKYGYKFQAGMYREGYFQNTFEDVGFVFVAQEKTEPYAVGVYVCSDGFIDEGYNQFRQAIGTYKYCKETNNWYGYEGPECIISELVEEGEND